MAVFAVILALATNESTAADWKLPPGLLAHPWVGDDAKPLRLRDMNARWVVTTMAYTACRKTCGTTALVLSEIQRRLDAMGVEADFVVVSYDPSNDSPAAWSEYRRKRGFERRTWNFVVGSPDATRQLARYLDLDFWVYDEHVAHDFRIVVFDAEWRAVADLRWNQIGKLDELLAPMQASAGDARH